MTQSGPGQQNPGQQNPGQQNPGQQNPGQQNPGQQNPGQQNPGQQNQLKVVVVGDGGCGKTSLLMVKARGDFPQNYAPSVFDKYVSSVSVEGKVVQLNLYDTAGQEDYDRLRPLSYVEANLVIVCFDVTNPSSFDNVLVKWYPEVRHFCRDVPIVLIGCKTDLRTDQECCRKLKAMNLGHVTYAQGLETQQQMKAEVYLECSAKHLENVEQVFKEAAKRTLLFQRRTRRTRRRKTCVMI